MPEKRSLLLSTFVFLDLETTGLPSFSFRPEITELCMIAVSRFSIEQQPIGVRPRVQNKLNLCFRPHRRIAPAASSISGLNRQTLFHQKDFDASVPKLINAFLGRLDPPICLIAHNGNRFDYPLLKSQLILASDDTDFRLVDCFNQPVVYADTLLMFRELGLPTSRSVSVVDDNDDSGLDQTPPKSTKDRPLAHSSPRRGTPPKEASSERPSFSLVNLHKSAFGHVHVNAHNAEADCLAMLDLVQHTGLVAIDWLQNNYIDFKSIAPMYKRHPSDVVLQSGLFPYKADEQLSLNKGPIDDEAAVTDELGAFKLE